MRVLDPVAEMRQDGDRLAPRPATLDGKVVAYVDGWGHRCDDGRFEMYALMAEIKRLLEERFQVGGSVWYKKPNIAKPVPQELLARVVQEADVIVNGECI